MGGKKTERNRVKYLRSVGDEVRANKRQLAHTKFPCRRRPRWIPSANGANRTSPRRALDGARLRRS